MNSLELINFWIESSDRDYETMLKNFETKQYTWSLFIGHLVLEKLLKAVYAKVNQNSPYPPKIHNLNVIAEKCGLELNDRHYKNEFYKKCTEEYTKEQIDNIKEVRKWLKEKLTYK